MLPQRAVLLLALLTRKVRAEPKDVAELFVVDFTTDENGGCRWVGADNLNLMIQDAWNLAGAGLKLLEHYREGVEGIPFGVSVWPEARRLVQKLWDLPPILDVPVDGEEDGVAFASNSFQQVKTWLETAGGGYDLSNPRRRLPQPKPHLFCDSDWLQPALQHSLVPWVAYEDIAGLMPGMWGENGVAMSGPNLPLHLSDIAPLLEHSRWDAAYELTMPPESLQLYWSSIHQRYFFAPSRRQTAPGRRPKNWRNTAIEFKCAGSTPWIGGHTMLASLNDEIKAFAAVTICPGGFDGRQARQLDQRLPDDWKRTWRYEPLRSSAAMDRVWDMANPERPPAGGGMGRGTGGAARGVNDIVELLSSSAALFHELFHLVLGRAASHPPDLAGIEGGSTEAFHFGSCAGTNPIHGNGPPMVARQRLRNPQNYVWAAHAYLATIAMGQDDDHQRIEFFASIATRGVGFLPATGGAPRRPRSYGMAWTREPGGRGGEQRRRVKRKGGCGAAGAAVCPANGTSLFSPSSVLCQ